MALDTTSPGHDPAYYAVRCMPRYRPGTREAEIQENEITTHRMVSGHPRVITFHRHFFTDEFVFVVLELCTDGDLFDAMIDLSRKHPGSSSMRSSSFIAIAYTTGTSNRKTFSWPILDSLPQSQFRLSLDVEANSI
ncbi:hypothetical protein K438DRAFT_1804012 [Mycena galopus ATCC 62051]|nr:hypothetical protein K438DRAFT_1804012 [Mycena galopus ATCC 62051]